MFSTGYEIKYVYGWRKISIAKKTLVACFIYVLIFLI
jgi:hypothetical protein